MFDTSKNEYTHQQFPLLVRPFIYYHYTLGSVTRSMACSYKRLGVAVERRMAEFAQPTCPLADGKGTHSMAIVDLGCTLLVVQHLETQTKPLTLMGSIPIKVHAPP